MSKELNITEKTMKTIIIIIIGLVFSAVMHAKDVGHVALARGFVVKCLYDTNVFIYNPVSLIIVTSQTNVVTVEKKKRNL